jgi:hypothetical protein
VTARGAQGKRREKAPRMASSRGTGYVFLLIGLLGSLHALIMVGVEVGRYLENAQEIGRLEGDVAALESELRGLELVLEHADDARYREHLARRQGFVFPSERRFFTLAEEE